MARANVPDRCIYQSVIGHEKLQETLDGPCHTGGVALARKGIIMSAREQVLYRNQSAAARLGMARSIERPVPVIPMERPTVFSRRWTLLWLGLRNHLSAMTGAWLEMTRASARLRPFEFVDPASGEIVSLSTSKEYSILSIGGRRYYFGRITGKFDGASSPLAARADGIAEPR
jgi:hypothetical protein